MKFRGKASSKLVKIISLDIYSSVYASIVLAYLYRITWIISIEFFDGLGFLDFWCYTSYFQYNLHTWFSLIFLLSICWVILEAYSLVLELGKFHLLPIIPHLLTLSLLIFNIIIPYSEFGGLKCEVDIDDFDGIRIISEEPKPYRGFPDLTPPPKL